MVVVGTEPFHDSVTLGGFGVVAQLVRLTRRMAFQPLAADGVWIVLTVMPVCGLFTVIAKPLIEVAPLSWPLMLTLVSLFAVPEQVRSSVPFAQVLAAPG